MVAVVALARLASAEGEDEELIRGGVDLRRHGNDARALELFQHAYSVRRSPRAAAQMGLAEQALGRWVAAFGHLREGLAAKDDPWIARNRITLSDAAARVAEHVGWLEIVGGSPGAEVRLDGIGRGQLPLNHSLVVTTGSVAIEITVPGRLPVQRTTVVRAGETTRESFEAPAVEVSRFPAQPVVRRGVPLVSPAPNDTRVAESPTSDMGEREVSPVGSARPRTEPDPVVDDGSTSARTPWILTTGALAVASLAFGIVEHLSWYSKIQAFDEMLGCDPKASDRGGSACAGLYDDGHRAKTLTFIGYGGGFAFASAAAALWLSGFNRGGPTDATVACSAMPGATGVSCATVF
jgi:hypothetical protein